MQRAEAARASAAAAAAGPAAQSRSRAAAGVRLRGAAGASCRRGSGGDSCAARWDRGGAGRHGAGLRSVKYLSSFFPRSIASAWPATSGPPTGPRDTSSVVAVSQDREKRSKNTRRASVADMLTQWPP